MTINDGEYKSVVGLRDLYIAAVSADGDAAYTAGTPQRLSYAATLSATPNQSFETQYADDGAFETVASEGETTFDLEVTAVPLETLALISGKIFDSTTGRVYDNAGTPGYFALGFRSLKSNGSYRYYWFLKGRFNAPNLEAATKGETAEPKIQKLQFVAVKTLHQFDLGDINDGVKAVIGDEDTDSFDATNWFAQVQVPGVAAVSALALSASVPVDGASGVAVGDDLTLTFNNALQADATARVVLTKDDGTLVAAAVTLDAARKIVTVNPTSNLSASSDYLLTYAVEDIYGQTLSGVVNFATA